LGGAVGAAAAGAIGGLTLNFAASAAAGGTIAGAATAVAINTAGGAVAGVAGTAVESVVNTGGLPTGSQVTRSAVIGAAAQNIAPAAQAVGKIAGAAMEAGVGSSSGVAQGGARAVGKATEQVVENAINSGTDAVTRTPRLHILGIYLLDRLLGQRRVIRSQELGQIANVGNSKRTPS